MTYRERLITEAKIVAKSRDAALQKNFEAWLQTERGENDERCEAILSAIMTYLKIKGEKENEQ